jgi:hypothetical protein
MEDSRIIKIIISDLSLEALKLEDELETTMNSSIEINEKVVKIKELLGKITQNEAMIFKFTQLVSTASNNNKT